MFTQRSRYAIRFFSLLFALCGASASILANSDQDIEFIIAAKKPPRGVVFEISTGSKNALQPALDQIDRYINQLKRAIPAIKLSIVSHGKEEFALLKENRKRFEPAHKKIQSLVNKDIPVHVCGTYASWFNYDKEDFPNYIDVPVSGPAKIIEYQRNGYALININPSE